jgi:Flp pilus assembly protein TadG
VKISRTKVDSASESGQAMTEFAIVLPFFMVLILGVIQFGVVWNDYVSLTDAARAGARKAAVSRHVDYKVEGCKTVRSSAPDLAASGKLFCDVRVAGDPTRPGADVTVVASYPYEIDLPFLGWALISGTLDTSTTERME